MVKIASFGAHTYYAALQAGYARLLLGYHGSEPIVVFTEEPGQSHRPGPGLPEISEPSFCSFGRPGFPASGESCVRPSLSALSEDSHVPKYPSLGSRAALHSARPVPSPVESRARQTDDVYK